VPPSPLPEPAALARLADLPGLRSLLGADGEGLGDEALVRAMTHRSYAYEAGGLPTNERLEFLGDAVLGLVVTDALFRSHPGLAEGQLAKLRASVVNMHALAGVARACRLGRHLLLGRGEEGTGGRDKPSILADSLEALIGTVYAEAGLDVARRLVRRLLDPLMAEAATRGAGLDWKTSLQELAATAGRGAPSYAVDETGPDHAKHFTARASVGGLVLGAGAGGTKKEAEQQAARHAYGALAAAPAAPPA